MVFGTAVSGIQAAASDMEVIGNNVANAASTGFKRSRAEFADVYAAGGGSLSIGGGTRLTRVQQLFGQGAISASGGKYDVAIQGNGFFIVSENGARSYTRNGSFGLDNEGFLVTGTRKNVIGYQPDGAGGIGPLLGPLRVDDANIAPSATTSVRSGVNVYNAAPPPAAAWAGGATPSTTTYNNLTSQTIYDSQGNSHTFNIYFIHADAAAAAGAPNASSPVGTNNQWYVAFQVDGQDVPALGGATNAANLYRMNFDSSGIFNGIQDTAGNPVAGNLIPLSFNPANGAAVMNFNVDLSPSTQFGSPFATQSASQNGYTTGRLDDVVIDDNGVLMCAYSNGQTKVMGQIAMANFSCPDGLNNLGDSAWSETTASGQALIGSPGSGSLGIIASGALEAANVNLTEELVNLITAQRNYQANSQTIKIADAAMQSIINLR